MAIFLYVFSGLDRSCTGELGYEAGGALNRVAFYVTLLEEPHCSDIVRDGVGNPPQGHLRL